MGQSTNLSITVHFEDGDKTNEAYHKVKEFADEQGRSPLMSDGGETEFNLEDWFDRQGSAEHTGNQYLNICKEIGGITYLSADLTQSIDSIYFDEGDEDEIGEFG